MDYQIHDSKIFLSKNDAKTFRDKRIVSDLLTVADDTPRDQARIEFERCTFQGTHIRRVTFSDAKDKLSKVEFIDCIIDDVDFVWSSPPSSITFKRCQFKSTAIRGDVTGISFIECDVNFDCSLDCRNSTGQSSFTSTTIHRRVKVRGQVSDADHADVNSLSQLLRAKRKTRWDDWCMGHSFWRPIVTIHWMLTDYGYSTSRLTLCYLLVNLVFTLVYCSPVYFGSRISMLESVHCENGLLLLHAKSFYFSLATTFTVGYGDIHPRHDSIVALLVACLHATVGGYIWAALIQRILASTQD